MGDFKTHIILMIIPGIIGNVVHMVVVKKNMFPRLAKPISTSLFGENKTWRGLLFLPVAIGLVCLLESALLGPFFSDLYVDFLFGAGLGFAYMLAELPNSYIKRKVGITSGETVDRYRFLQLLADKTDSLLGVCIYYYFMVVTTFQEIMLLFFISLILHISISYVLVLFKLKKSI